MEIDEPPCVPAEVSREQQFDADRLQSAAERPALTGPGKACPAASAITAQEGKHRVARDYFGLSHGLQELINLGEMHGGLVRAGCPGNPPHPRKDSGLAYR
jgi:hypothetical protein